jgi:ATP-dependent RNA helicase DeaD
MTEQFSLEAAPFGLEAVLRTRGFERLTPIQAAVLDPEMAGRDLRICSQTGSGKTVALGFVLGESVRTHADRVPADDRMGRPSALVIAPTRELAAQLTRELSWLYGTWRVGVVGVTGGAAYDAELRGLRRHPALVVGTPGRLHDHLRRGSLSLDSLTTLVLDEADEMLDMGFEEELDAIRAFAPDERQSLLVSATFGHRVARVADRLQRDPVWIHGTPLGVANQDITHIGMLVDNRLRADAVVNVLLRNPDDKTLVFVKTRAATQELAAFLAGQGFSARALTGEMTHRERTQTFGDFRGGVVHVLVATDVAARGLDVSDIGRVIQVDPPQNAEVFTHRGGRTGRAGKSGENVLLVPPRSRRKAEELFRAAKVRATFAAPPTPREIELAADARLVERIRKSVRPAAVDAAPLDTDGVDSDGEAGAIEAREARRPRKPGRPDPRALAVRLLAEADAIDVVAHLVSQIGHAGPCAPRHLPVVHLGPASAQDRDAARTPHRRSPDGSRFAPDKPRKEGGRGSFVTFQVSWGERAGADPRRLLAVVCRRGRIGRDDVGTISIARDSSTVDVAVPKVAAFEVAVRQPDHRDPHVRFRRWRPPAGGAPRGVRRAAQPA